MGTGDSHGPGDYVGVCSCFGVEGWTAYPLWAQTMSFSSAIVGAETLLTFAGIHLSSLNSCPVLGKRMVTLRMAERIFSP